jgi:vacuolar-type H+-ATPase subunit E/Vma4
MPGPEPRFDEDFLLKWTNELRLNLEHIAENEDFDSVSEVVREACRAFIRDRDLDPSVNPNQTDAFEVDKEVSSPFDNDFQREG